MTTRRNFLAAGIGVGVAAMAGTERLIFVSMTGGPSQSDLFDFQAGSWTPDWMDPIGGFPRGLMPRLADRRDEIRLLRGLRAGSTNHRTALEAHPVCGVTLRAERATFGDACAHARTLIARQDSVRIDFGSWDHHGNLYAQLQTMCAAFDRGMAEMIGGLRSDGRPVRVIAVGEFGRKPGPLNANRGRDHWPEHAALIWNHETAPRMRPI